MAGRLIFVTHPDVLIDPAVPVPDWPLSERGRARMAGVAGRSWARAIRHVVASGERKARDGAAILARGLGLAGHEVIEGLGENDRSATGYLAKAEFEVVADAFFARPLESVRGWESAVDAQARIVAAIEAVLALGPGEDDIAVVGHGGTGTLLRCHLAGWPIDRRHDQPPTNGGNWLALDRVSLALVEPGWRSIDAD